MILKIVIYVFKKSSYFNNNNNNIFNINNKILQLEKYFIMN